ncbi:MAG: hypothetical protein GY940_17480 [bacterium]|nr:hypothetical protein [bacterium]
MIREIMVPDKEQLVIDIPREYMHKEVEVLVFPITEEEGKNSEQSGAENLKEYKKLITQARKSNIKLPEGADIDDMINEMYDHDLS